MMTNSELGRLCYHCEDEEINTFLLIIMFFFCSSLNYPAAKPRAGRHGMMDGSSRHLLLEREEGGYDVACRRVREVRDGV